MSTNLRFTIGDGRVYDAADIESLSLRDILTVERETEELGRKMTFSDITNMVHQMGALPRAEAVAHPDAAWVLAATIWASRRAAGETLTFSEAIDVPLNSIRFITPPTDHKGAKSADPTKRPPGSGRARKSAPAPAKS